MATCRLTETGRGSGSGEPVVGAAEAGGTPIYQQRVEPECPSTTGAVADKRPACSESLKRAVCPA